MRTLLAQAVLALLTPAFAFCNPLAIVNKTDQDIMNILVESPGHEAFLRLDLLPGATDQVDNPGFTASLRVDTGLQFWSFANIDLAKTVKLVFCNEHPVCLVCETGTGPATHIAGTLRPLVPQPGDKPVCNLDRFHPSMPMKEVCAILPHEMPHDDNGALLTGMGFAGMTWAARLVPAQTGPVSENSLLEHLELRRPLEISDLVKLTDALFRQGYVPWQAEFPGLDMEFEDKADAERQKLVLLQTMERFMDSRKTNGHKNHSIGEKCEEASIIMAPGNMLQCLESADEPTSDVQIFTIVLRPCTQTLLLDVAAYRGHEAVAATQ